MLRLCYPDSVARTITSSFRISEELRDQLADTAGHLGKGKNWIITRALEEYLARVGRKALAEEARRQSLAASGVTTEDEENWAEPADTEDWR